MSSELDAHIDAYGEEFKYAFDNDIILNWYPKRIMALTKPESNVLELGVGHGYTSKWFSEYFKKHVVIDGSRAVINRFKEKYPACKSDIVEAYFENFDTDQVFDVIVMGFVLEHVADPGLVLRHYKRYLVPGGRCFVAVPNAECLHRRIGQAAGLLPDMMTLGEGDKSLGHLRLYTVDLIEREFINNGYRVVSKEGVFLKPFTTNQLKNMQLSNDVIEAMCEVGKDYPELCAAILIEAEV